MQITQLTNLQNLTLDNNQLSALPLQITQLTNLQNLTLNDNQLSALPLQITQLTNLQTLRVRRNGLILLPPEIAQLTRLHTLGLAHNQLRGLPPEITQLTSLQTLELNGNQLTVLPPEISELTSLQTLELSLNYLTVLPPEISQLTNLQTLELSLNRLTGVPLQLADLLAKGLLLKLGENPLKEPFSEFVERGADALATYLRSLHDASPQYEAKVLLVGEGNVGKTTLVDSLQNLPFQHHPTTHGIEIKVLKIRHPDHDLDMTIRTWDFGGQEVYRITHQFFLSRRALYLVVWNARQGQEQDDVDGWLRRIRLRVKQDARALIVATNCKERHPDLDYAQLQRDFAEMLAGQYAVDNKYRLGISELHNAIAQEVARLPQMGQLISPRWIAARDEILNRARSEPQMSYEQFTEICRRHRVDDNEIATLAELMHDLGHIVYYGDDEGLRNFVVLDPEWLSKAISYVLEDDSTRRSNGVLDHARLAQIWQDREEGLAYPTRYHPYFLRLMEKFDISYRLEGNEYRSLVAQLVSRERPELPWDSRALPSEGIRDLALVCKLSEPVPGLIAWLTVRHHSASTGNHWRNGVFLRHPITRYASEALMELRTPTELAIDVHAPSPDLFFNVLRYSVEDLISRRWPGLSYTLFVPCPTRTAGGLRCRGQFPLNFLLGYREKSDAPRYVPCHECLTDWDISKLLTGFAQSDLDLRARLEWLQSKVTYIDKRFDDIERYAAESADFMRRVMRVASSEVTDCPRLFTLVQENPVGARRLKIYQRHYRLTLWCEHPGHWHPQPEATYSIDQPRDWFVRVGPYATLIFKVLQVATPIATAATGVALTDEQFKNAQRELKLMEALIASLPRQKAEDQLWPVADGVESQLTQAEGQALRALRILLFEHDHRRSFGDLRRVNGVAGDFFWVCAKHYANYDPGLPKIPIS